MKMTEGADMHDEVDLRLVNILQIDPRIPWARAGEILGISATTAANRWRRLNEAGLAWISTYPNLTCQFTATVEVDCRTEFLPSAIKALCENPLIVNVDETTGTRDLLLMVIAPDMDTLTRLIIDWIGGLNGVYGTRSSLVTEVIASGESWRVNALNREQVRKATLQLTPDRAITHNSLDVSLSEALARDGRASVASLAQLLDEPPSTVHRRLQKLRGNRQIIMRCDLAPELAGWLLEYTWLTTVAFSHKQRVIELLRGQPSLRSCIWTTGANNLRVNFRANHLGGLGGFESAIASSLPGLAPAETIIHMRNHKSMGWLLANRGRCTGELVTPVFSTREPS